MAALAPGAAAALLGTTRTSPSTIAYSDGPRAPTQIATAAAIASAAPTANGQPNRRATFGACARRDRAACQTRWRAAGGSLGTSASRSARVVDSTIACSALQRVQVARCASSSRRSASLACPPAEATDNRPV